MNRDQMLKEARTIEAMRKGYMGLEGKFATIARRLGQPIFHQGSRVFEQTFLEDPYDSPDENSIPMMDDEEESYEVGLQFDGLSRGINMTISVAYHLREIVVRYEGRIVYKEVAGELEGFVGGDQTTLEWEDRIDKLFSTARQVERTQRPQERRLMAEQANLKREKILAELRAKWGLE